jgi:hypothetical protein
LMVDEPSSFLIVLASIHFVNLSTATRRCVKPPGCLLEHPYHVEAPNSEWPGERHGLEGSC